MQMSKPKFQSPKVKLCVRVEAKGSRQDHLPNTSNLQPQTPLAERYRPNLFLNSWANRGITVKRSPTIP